MLERELLLKLAAEYGTPLFVYDGDMVVERYNDLFRFRGSVSAFTTL